MKYDFSVVILTFNHEKYIRKLVEKVFSSSGKFSIEIVVLDSGSTDSTRTIVEELQKKHRNITCQYFENRYFNHGLTRNLGVRLSKGELILFVSADALPLSSNFFEKFSSVFNSERRVVACYGKEVVRTKSPFIQKLDLLMYYHELDYFAKGMPLIISRKVNLPDRIKYSLNNVFSVYRRKYLSKNRFPKISYGEDLVAGQKIVRDGYAIAYIPASRVLHSHFFSTAEYFKRQVADFKLRYKVAGLTFNVTISQKIKFVLAGKVNIWVKIVNLMKLGGYYLVKSAAFFYSRFV